MTDDLRLAVVESRWWEKGNHSVKGFFDNLAQIHVHNSFGYHYEMFNNLASLREIVVRVAGYSRIQRLYLACHGEARHLYGSDGKAISSYQIKKLFHELNSMPRKVLKGVYFGSCYFLDEHTASYIFNKTYGDSEKIRWMCGYNTDIGWIESTVLDTLFFNYFYDSREDTEGKRLLQTADNLKRLVPHLIEHLGFGIYVRKRGGGIRNLVSADDGQ